MTDNHSDELDNPINEEGEVDEDTAAVEQPKPLRPERPALCVDGRTALTLLASILSPDNARSPQRPLLLPGIVGARLGRWVPKLGPTKPSDPRDPPNPAGREGRAPACPRSGQR